MVDPAGEDGGTILPLPALEMTVPDTEVSDEVLPPVCLDVLENKLDVSPPPPTGDRCSWKVGDLMGGVRGLVVSIIIIDGCTDARRT